MLIGYRTAPSIDYYWLQRETSLEWPRWCTFVNFKLAQRFDPDLVQRSDPIKVMLAMLGPSKQFDTFKIVLVGWFKCLVAGYGSSTGQPYYD